MEPGFVCFISIQLAIVAVHDFKDFPPGGIFDRIQGLTNNSLAWEPDRRKKANPGR